LEASYDGGLYRRGRRTDEFAHLVELGQHGLALYTELLGEFVHPDLRHYSPSASVRDMGLCRTVVSSSYSSLRTHQALIAISTCFLIATQQWVGTSMPTQHCYADLDYDNPEAGADIPTLSGAVTLSATRGGIEQGLHG